jgi:two-component sensor histidine kinase
MEQQQSKFELGKKQEEIDNLNKITELQKRIAFVLLISIFAVSILLFILYRSNKKIKKTNEIISKQKVLVEQRENEKSLLLRELNHRVKNNLQMVASLLNLNARQLKGHPAAEALLASKLRVEALTLIHQKLYRDDVDTKVDIRDYIEELSRNLVQNFGQEFELQLHLQSILINIDRAVPLGLIINELVTNSLKYGKNGNTHPMLKITSACHPESISITIHDNGSGLPQDINLETATSFGLKLVNSLAKQLNGELNCDSDSGTKWVLKLQMDKIN